MHPATPRCTPTLPKPSACCKAWIWPPCPTAKCRAPTRISASLIQTETLRAREAALPEAHLNHIDIQVPLNGRETYGWIDRSRLQHGQGYNEERDIEFFRCTPETWFDLEMGEFALFFPNDGHAPLVGTPGQTIRKAVFKIRSADCRID